MGTMTAETATSRLREAVNLVQRGQLQEAVRMLTAVSRVCAAALGEEHPTTVASRYWQAVCLARLGAGRDALTLFAKVSTQIDGGTGRRAGMPELAVELGGGGPTSGGEDELRSLLRWVRADESLGPGCALASTAPDRPATTTWAPASTSCNSPSAAACPPAPSSSPSSSGGTPGAPGPR
ncbi:tetratricopeptide repeat protein [Streptomyces sp. M19]